MQSKSSTFSVDVKKFNLHILAVVNNKFYMQKVNSMWLVILLYAKVDSSILQSAHMSFDNSLRAVRQKEKKSFQFIQD